MPDPQTQTTDTSQVSYADMAQKIRAKYPQSKLYKSKPDKDLVDAWVQAKPERAVYAKRIKGFDPDNTGGKGVPSGQPFHTGGRATPTILQDAEQIKERDKTTDYVGAGLPTALGTAGALLGGGKGPIAAAGATLGGVVGAGLRDIGQRIVFDKEISNKQEVYNMAKEGAMQGAMQFGGEKLGEVFFKTLNKIPHAVIKNGIKLLPSDLNPNGKVMKYVEDLLSNLAPSAKTMEEFKAQQSKDVVDKVNTIVKGFSRFNGTSEEMGTLLQKTLTSGREAVEAKLKALNKGYMQKGASAKQAAQYVTQTQVYKDYVKSYENELVKSVIATNKPELIAGLLRSTHAALNETRVMNETLKGLDGEVLGKVRNQILRDMVSETVAGSKDPTAKGVQNLAGKYSGNKFKDIADKMGEEKLKAIMGEAGYKQIEDFITLTGGVGNGGNGGVGKFLNLIFLVPFRGAVGKATGMAFMANRAAKVITSTEGMRLYENVIRATTSNIPRATKLALDEYNKFIMRQDDEFKQEQKATEEKYYKDHPDELKYRKQENQ